MRERTEAYEYRRKFYPGTGPTPGQAGLEGADSTKSGGYGGVPSYGGSTQSVETYKSGAGLGQSASSKVYSPYD
jgi:hypothetical protein